MNSIKYSSLPFVFKQLITVIKFSKINIFYLVIKKKSPQYIYSKLIKVM